MDDALLDQLERDWLARSREAVTDRVAALNRCVKKLPEDARALLRMRYADGLTGRAMAARLGRTKVAVFQTLSRPQRGLRRCVDAEFAGRAGRRRDRRPRPVRRTTPGVLGR